MGKAVGRVVVGLSGVLMLSGVALAAAAQAPDPNGVAATSTSAQSPVWLPMPATKAPGLAQPPALTPGSSPYPRTNFPSLGGVIAQPQFVSPEAVVPADEVVVSDSAVASKSAPPTPASPPAPPRKFEPAPARAAPTKTSRFWEFVLGPNQQAPASTTAAPAATTSQPRPATTARTTASSSNSGGSLLSQLLGTSSPPPREPAASITPETKQLAHQLLLTSAEEETAAPPVERKPTVRDVEEAKTPATSMTISRPGSIPQMGVPIEPTPDPAPSMAGVPSVPSVSSQAFDGVAAALWRPLTMTNDAPTVALPDGPNVRKTAADDRARLPESERVPSLLRPFYATNAPPPTASRRDADAQSTDVTSSVADALIRSSLGRQLAMSSDEDLRTSTVASIEAEVKRDQQPWDGTVTVHWPLMANPFTLTDAAEPPNYASGDVAQVAFLQETLPSPPAGSPAPDTLDLPGEENGSDDEEKADGGDKKKDEKDTLVGAKTLGTAPEDNTLEFLRTSTVLLEPGKSQFDIGLQYTLTENDFPILLTDGMGDVVVDNVEFKGRELSVPMELRYGLLRRVQAFVQVPVGWANVQAAINDFDEFANDGGVGDVGFGLTMQLRDAEKDRPYLIGTVAGLAPSGGSPFLSSASISPNAPSLGNGFWAISGNLLWVQTRYDPVVVFYGFGARYQFEREYLGIEFKPGTEYNYTLGTGFAVNERVTLSTQFFGSYIEELSANGERVEGTIQEPMNLRLAATLAKPCNRIVEPFVSFGLTDDSISANFGITWTY